MKILINEREAEWIIEGARLKKLREDRQMSRAKLARLMKISDARLARLENGEGVRDAGILSSFYEYIIKYHDLHMEHHHLAVIFEALYIDGVDLIEESYLME